MRILTSNFNNKCGVPGFYARGSAFSSDEIRSLELANNDDLPSNLNTKPNTQPNIQASKHMDEPLETDLCGPSLPTQFGQSVQSEHGTDLISSEHSEQGKEAVGQRKHKVRAKHVSRSSSTEESESSVQVKKSSKPKKAPSDQDKQQTDPSFFIGK